MKKADREDFEAYLRFLTDSQVAGVRDKEHARGRAGAPYKRLAEAEAKSRAIELPAIQPYRFGSFGR